MYGEPMSVTEKYYEAIIVKASGINKQGVFAARNFRQGETVIAWNNTRPITKAEYNALSAHDRNYIEIRDDGTYLLVGVPERYVNHSCEPATAPDMNGNDVALRDIRQGEEITTDYQAFSIPEGRFNCHCGSSKCRGVITGRLPSEC
jgi:SET domain-containing protein